MALALAAPLAPLAPALALALALGMGHHDVVSAHQPYPS